MFTVTVGHERAGHRSHSSQRCAQRRIDGRWSAAEWFIWPQRGGSCTDHRLPATAVFMPAASFCGAGVVPVHVFSGPTDASVHTVSVGPHQWRPRLQRIQEVGVQQQFRPPRPSAEGRWLLPAVTQVLSWNGCMQSHHNTTILLLVQRSYIIQSFIILNSGT